jgi:uncharacterized protein (TIGR04255 family)
MTVFPKKITPCPIVEAIFEIRFNSSLPEDAIFGVLYNQFKDEYPKFEQLPIMQLPASIRAQDPSLRYNPHYKTQIGNFPLRLGPRSISISNVEEYIGWVDFSQKVFATFEQATKSGVIANIERLGLRYINILEGINIFDNSNIVISLKNDPIIRKTNINTEISFDKGVCVLKATSDAEVNLGGNQRKMITGSVIDIDAIVDHNKFKDINDAIEYAHNIEKELFYRILSDEFIKTLNPEY